MSNSLCPFRTLKNQIIILCPIIFTIFSSNFFYQRTVCHKEMRNIIIRPKQIFIIIWLHMWLKMFRQIHGYLVFIRIQYLRSVIFIDRFYDFIQCIRRQQIIMIQQSDIISRCTRQCGIRILCNSFIFRNIFTLILSSFVDEMR